MLSLSLSLSLPLQDQKAMFIVVGTKCDIEDSKREVTSEMLQSFAAHHDLPAFEVFTLSCHFIVTI